MDKEVIEFLNNQKLLSIATINNELPWIFNVYYSIDKDFNIYFVSPESNNHSKHIKLNSNVSFTSVWFDNSNLDNRKSIQGRGVCSKVTNIKDVTHALRIHLKKYPEWSQFINLNNILNKVIESRVYVIKPTYIKYWDDELYGEEGIKEFNL